MISSILIQHRNIKNQKHGERIIKYLLFQNREQTFLISTTDVMNHTNNTISF